MSFYNEQGFDQVSAEAIHRNKLKCVKGPNGEQQRTRYLCQVIDFEEKQGYKGYSMLLHFHVVQGPQDIGMKSAFIGRPQDAKPESRGKELAKIKRNVGAALFALNEQQASSVNGPAIQGALRKGTTPSPMRGRLFYADAIPHKNKEGKDTSFTEFAPYLENGQPVDRPIDASVQADADQTPAHGTQAPAQAPVNVPAFGTPVAPSAPPAPVAPSAPPAPPAPVDHIKRAFAAGWQAHPTSPGWFYLGNAVKSDADIRAGNF
jgi:hypothetical protein